MQFFFEVLIGGLLSGVMFSTSRRGRWSFSRR
jgi:hypothetical protein